MKLVTERLGSCWVKARHAARELHIVFRFAVILLLNRLVVSRQRRSHLQGGVVHVRDGQPEKTALPFASARTLSRSDPVVDQPEEVQRSKTM